VLSITALKGNDFRTKSVKVNDKEIDMILEQGGYVDNNRCILVISIAIL
jgi:hypothetical protein